MNNSITIIYLLYYKVMKPQSLLFFFKRWNYLIISKPKNGASVAITNENSEKNS